VEVRIGLGVHGCDFVSFRILYLKYCIGYEDRF
jgi:hypothetical protein